MSRLDRSVSIHVPIWLSTESLQRGDLVERICETVDRIVEGEKHVVWVEIEEQKRQDDGSSEIRVHVHRCCSDTYRGSVHSYHVRRIDTGRYAVDPK